MKTITSVKLDKDVKTQASKLAAQMGLNLSVVINATLKKFVNERRIDLYVEPEFNEKTKKELLEIMADVKKGRNLSKSYTDTRELFKDLGI